MPPRRFPPPWSVEDIDAAFAVKDGSGQKLAYIYYEDEPGRRKCHGAINVPARSRRHHGPPIKWDEIYLVRPTRLIAKPLLSRRWWDDNDYISIHV
jgi:hypothetical protein